MSRRNRRPKKNNRQGRSNSPQKKNRKSGSHPSQHPRSGPRPRPYRKDSDDGGTQYLATLDKNRKGFGFLIFDDRELEDLFLPAHVVSRFFHGDRVRVELSPRDEVRDIQLVEHRYRQLMGQYVPHPRKPDQGWISYENRKFNIEIPISQMNKPARAGDWIKGVLQFHKRGPEPVTAEITESFGSSYPASQDLEMISAEFGLQEEHSQKAISEAKAFGPKVIFEGKDNSKRRDLRKTPFITIDGADARDFDDAVFVEKKGEDYLLWVAIADVSHYVTPGSALDQEAYDRANSTYFPERAFHMLPEALSAGLCSLIPQQDRFALVCQMTFNKNGKPIKTQVFDAVIHSHRRATYDQIFQEYQENKGKPQWEFRPHFELFSILEKVRKIRGSLDFEFPESLVKVDPEGNPVSIEIAKRNEAHRLIETFMIAANEAVTQWLHDRSEGELIPFIYRIHETPDEVAIRDFLKFARSAGLDTGGGGEMSQKKLSKLLDRLAGHPSQDLLSMMLLRSLKQAVYSEVHDIHFGLASEGYTHFTSPIRRYSDLVVHRILKAVMNNTPRKLLPKPKDLARIAQQCSYRERLSADAEREAKKIKQVRFMAEHLGDDFEGKIIGMNDMGFFVQINSPFVEGMVPKDSLTDDFYRFDPEKMIYSGRKKGRLFKMGQVLRVQVVRADLIRRRVEFMTLD